MMNPRMTGVVLMALALGPGLFGPACRSRSEDPAPAKTEAPAEGANDRSGTLPPVSDVANSVPPSVPRGPKTSVRGTVRWEGQAIAAERTELPASVHKVCGQTLETSPIQLHGDRIEGVVVAAAVAPVAELPQKVLPAVPLDQAKCAYVPAVFAATLGSELAIRNSDPLIHNIHAKEQGKTLFNFAMPLAGMTSKKRLDTAGVVELRCDVHPWMRATVRVFDHPTFALTDGQGGFQLDGIPVGRQKLIFWHPRLGEQVREVEVSAEVETVVDLSIRALAPKS